MRLAVLTACEVGQRDETSSWAGVVTALTRAGIPAVVGMQFRIRDADATAFSRAFYRSLAAGEPVDGAVTEGRLAVLDRGGEGERDWGAPVLYLRAEDGVLFPQPAASGAGGVLARDGAGGVRTAGVVQPVPDKRVLRQAIVDAFTVEDLALVCSDIEAALAASGVGLQVNLEMVGGTSKPVQVLRLIEYLDHRGHLPYLVSAVREHRPGLV